MILTDAQLVPAIAPAQTAGAVLVLLAGGTAPSPLERALGCSLLDLDVAPGMTLLDWWAARDWCGRGQERHVRTARGTGSRGPSRFDDTSGTPVIVRHHVDSGGPRGSAGAIRDVCESDASETTIVAAESSTAMLAALEPILADHAESGADVTLVTTTSGRPAGLALIRRGTLDLVKARGFVDFKEQFLPALVKAGRRVNLVEVLEDESVAMHDRRGLIEGMQRIAVSIQGGADDRPPPLIDPRWGPSVIAEGAEVDPSALVTASLVLRGASVGAEAILARSVIAPGAVVGRGEVVIDRIVSADRDQTSEHKLLESRRGVR